MARPVGGLEFDSGRRSLIFLLLFFSFGIFLVIVVLFCFFDSVSFFYIFRFSFLFPYFPFLPTSCRSPEVLREVLRFTYF